MKDFVKIFIFGLWFLMSVNAFALPPEESAQSVDNIENTDSSLAVSTDYNLHDFEVTVTNPFSSELSNYTLNFELKTSNYLQLDAGGLAFSFPEGFDLAKIEEVGLSDNYNWKEYEITSFKVTGQTLWINLKRINNHDNSKSYWFVELEVQIKTIGNPIVPGTYNLTGIAYDHKYRIIAGPTESEDFEIDQTEWEIVELKISPDTNLVYRAGSSITFTVVGIDNNGNLVEDVDYSIYLTSSSDRIGYFNNSTLNLERTGTGRVRAVFENLSVESGFIEVIPGDLAEIKLNISHHQVVGYELLNTADITLLDAYGNHKYDYDLSNDPVYINCSEFSLSPNIFDDNSLLNDGIIDLIPLGIKFEENSATVEIRAESGSVISNPQIVSFNGYDILDVFNTAGDPFNELWAGQETALKVFTQNNGTTKANDFPVLKYHYKSTGEIRATEFTGGYGGLITSTQIRLPSHQNEPISDILIVELAAVYTLYGNDYTVDDYIEIPFTVISQIEPQITATNFSPVIVEAGKDARFYFDILLNESFPYQIKIISSQFSITNGSFNSFTIPDIENNLLVPGVNSVNSGLIYIPESINGGILQANIKFDYQIVGLSDKIYSYASDFDNISIHVTSKPIIKIDNLVVETPNAPKVNTSQAFIIKAQITNLSGSELTDIPVQLLSDGNSYSAEKILNLSANETVEVVFDVTAGAAPTLNETFHLRVMSDIIAVDYNNTRAFIVIESPANLELSYALIGLDNGIIQRGKSFTLLVDLKNSGSSQVTNGEFLISSDNQGMHIPEPVSGTININNQLRFDITAVDYNTVTLISFDLTSLPIELNTGFEAPLNTAGFTFEVQIVTESTLPQARIIEVKAESPNAPNVNTGQNFKINCTIENLSENRISDLRLLMQTDGKSNFTPEQTITIEANSYNTISYEVFAAMDTSSETFTLNILSSGYDILPSIDNTALIIIDSPADLKLNYEFIGTYGNTVNPGREFKLAVVLENTGTAAVNDVPYELTTGGVDFGDKYEPEGIIKADELNVFTFIAPLENTRAAIVFTLSDIPVDRNTGLNAPLDIQSISNVISVETIDGKLLVDVNQIGTNLLVVGRIKELFDMELNNRINDEASAVKLNEMTISFLSNNNLPLNIEECLDLLQTGFYFDGQIITTASIDANKLKLKFNDFFIEKDVTKNILFKMLCYKALHETFKIKVDCNTLKAVYSGGPLLDQMAVIESKSGDPVRIFSYLFKGTALEESVVVENNPFDPRQEPLRFSFELDIESGVQYRIFTLTGEEVYAKNVAFSNDGARLGENVFEWHGNNNEGDLIINGVYVVMIRVIATGEVAKTKVAVIR